MNTVWTRHYAFYTVYVAVFSSSINCNCEVVEKDNVCTKCATHHCIAAHLIHMYREVWVAAFSIEYPSDHLPNATVVIGGNIELKSFA